MSKHKLEYYAAKRAVEVGKAYGFSVFGGFFYVGTVEELKAIGCIRIEDSTPLEGSKGRV